jgi:hypothetical protein
VNVLKGFAKRKKRSPNVLEAGEPLKVSVGGGRIVPKSRLGRLGLEVGYLFF